MKPMRIDLSIRLAGYLLALNLLATSLTCTCAPGLAATATSQIYHPTDLLIRSKDLSATAPQTLTEEQVKADIGLLLYALRRAYGGRKYVPADIYSHALEKLEQITGAMTPADLRDKIDEILWTIPDNHLKARIKGKGAKIRESAMRSDDAGPNAISSGKEVWEVRLEHKNGLEILYISILHFPSGQDPVWKGFIDQVKSGMKQSQLLVLDLRGNGGGDDEMGRRLARLCYGNTLNSPVSRQITSQTPETIALSANMYKGMEDKQKAEGKSPASYLDTMYKHFMRDFHQAMKGKLSEEDVFEVNARNSSFQAKRGYDKPIYILMDGGCGSSGESTIDAFESQPSLKRVGKNTAGTKHFGNVGFIVLPNSKVNVQMATKYNEYFDKRFIEKIGIKPDIETVAGEDAYDAALKDFVSSAKVSDARTRFGEQKLPTSTASRSIGTSFCGCLAGAKALALDAPGWQVLHPELNRYWAHPDMIDYISNLSNRTRALGWNGLLIGDIGMPKGGPFPSYLHETHQRGIDADIILRPAPDHKLSESEAEILWPSLHGPNWASTCSVLKVDSAQLDPDVWTANHAKFVQAAAQDENVSRIFVTPAIKQYLCFCKDRNGKDTEWLRRLRPWVGHDDHIHVRLNCPKGDPCIADPPLPKGDGCGSELTSWMKYIDKNPPNTSSPHTYSLEYKAFPLNGMPKECLDLLKAGSD